MAALFLAIFPAQAATMAGPSKPDPLLDGGPSTPCAAGADYAAGTDATGRAVVPADVEGRKVPVPDQIAIPLGKSAPNGRARATRGDSSYVSLDGRKLDPLVNPEPCH